VKTFAKLLETFVKMEGKNQNADVFCFEVIFLVFFGQVRGNLGKFEGNLGKINA